MRNEEKWRTYRKEYSKQYRVTHPEYKNQHYEMNKEKYKEYIKKSAIQKQLKEQGLEPLPRTKRNKYELAKMREERYLRDLEIRASKFREFLKSQSNP